MMRDQGSSRWARRVRGGVGKARTALATLSVLASLLAATGCARGPDVEASGLGLRRVVIYRNGVAYFEREGRIDAEQVTFRVRKEKVGDFLATLAVMEAGGSSVRSASFPVEVDEPGEEGDEEPTDPRFEVLLKPPPPQKGAAKKKERMETVRLTLDGREHDLVVGYVAETPVWRPSYRLVLGEQRGASGTGGAGSGGSGGKGSARQGGKTAHLQAWGIVQNLSGEDWKGVKLTLVAGAPLAFQATLDQPSIPVRPVVTDQGEVIASVPTSETSLAQGGEAPPPPPPPPPSMPMEHEAEMDADDSSLRAEAGKLEGKADRPATTRGRVTRPEPKKAYAPMAPPAGAASGMPVQRGPATGDGYMYDLAEQKPAMPAAPRNMSALAAVAVEAGNTRYELPFTVDVPDKSATMVLLMAREVTGESIFLYAPDGGVPDSSTHPFRVARFKNETQGLLERGPIAVFENGAFLGQGMVDPLPPGATTTVPFALERALAVDRNREETQEGSRLAKIESGMIEIERDWVVHTKYAIRNGSEDAAKTLVKHPRLHGTRLHNVPKETEDNLGTGSALLPIAVPARGSAVLDVDERRTYRQQVDWLSQLADDAVKGYLKDPRSEAAVVQQLGQAWEMRGKLRPAVDERDKLGNEQARLSQQSEELRRNLRAIEKNKTAEDLRRDLTERLAKASARLDEITKRLIVLEMQINELEVRFRDLTQAIRMVRPPSPVRATP
ncbi:hypothetical protein [Chondromyces apiculatus]|uniref:DUF4139 domain-containing protein n=1 Tax=Chondromyces apiculatus DSM 436 TaxID=1192034 RepID=A0A017TFE2_9BACT|nr:hypothetical protein [Chondromyces apiculatus]EYF08003.1 Hypothetical protein CAP_7025 [Chondromyces apiculatus DSM 436]